jgi:predicted RNase H-like nuclease
LVRRFGMRVLGVDACRGGWAAVSVTMGFPAELSPRSVSPTGKSALEPAPGTAALTAGRPHVTVRAGVSLREVLGPLVDPDGSTVVGIDMPLGLLSGGWREADRTARRLLGPRRSSVFAIPPREVWTQASYQAANLRCRELTGQGFSAQAWGLRAKLLEADKYRDGCRHPLYEVHPELAFGAMAGAPLADSKHTAAGRAARLGVLAGAGIEIPEPVPAAILGDVLDAAAVAWSAWRIAAGQAVIIPSEPQLDDRGRPITISY